MIYECAPMEGVTGDLFRQAQRLHFAAADCYYTPFLSPTASRVLAARELREVEPSHNEGIRVVPQLMGHEPNDFLWMTRALADLGYDEVNLNLGCPSGTVVTKKKGAGLLAERDLLRRMLDGIFDLSPLPISIKTRLGMAEAEEFPPILELYNDYPIKELIAHRVTHAMASTSGVQSETAGGVSVTYNAAWTNNSRATALADDNKEVLAPYKVRGVF